MRRLISIRVILVSKAYDPSGLRQESRALGATISACAIDEDLVKPDGQNSVVSFVISQWLLPELSIPAAGQKDRRLWGRGCIRVTYMLAKEYISYTLYTTLSAFPCGRTQHLRRVRSSIASMIQSVLEFRFEFMRAIPHSRLNRR